MKFTFFNDTGRIVNIHPASKTHGIHIDMTPIKPSDIREFYLPEGTQPWVKMWDYGGKNGLHILVSSQKESI